VKNKKEAVGVIAPEGGTDKGCKQRIDKGGGCYMITPAEESLRKNPMCRLHIGVIFTKLYYYSRYWKMGLITDTARVRAWFWFHQTLL